MTQLYIKQRKLILTGVIIIRTCTLVLRIVVRLQHSLFVTLLELFIQALEF